MQIILTLLSSYFYKNYLKLLNIMRPLIIMEELAFVEEDV